MPWQCEGNHKELDGQMNGKTRTWTMYHKEEHDKGENEDLDNNKQDLRGHGH